MNTPERPQIAFGSGDDLASIVARIATEAPDRVALIAGERQQSWRELDTAVDGVASALATRLAPSI